ncbi:sterol 3beta-glucosyltransferase [Amycolatopsis bartoniae]|nr:glycosyltransferase [Amycolatopsis bartoniae]MBB2933556.1 sterol 3beta-glucosyltransferase [Amycolatopsis bartoniae]TVT10736.1 glycosyltransferase family 1 protein [Amycolatopsis bartoniae]
MKVLILTHGTRGDVQPYVALSRALDKAGHRAVLAAPRSLVPFGVDHGVEMLPIDDGPNEMVDDPVVQEAYRLNYRGLRGKKLAAQLLRKHRPLMAKVLRDIVSVSDVNADLLVHHVVLPGNEIAEKLGIPSVAVCLQPMWVPTSEFPDPLCPFPVPSLFNKLSYISTRLWYRAALGSSAGWRRQVLQLPSRRGRQNFLRRPDGGSAAVLQAFSRYIASPAAYPASVHTTGFWFLPSGSDWSPPVELNSFIELDTRPVVYIGFGSMLGDNATAAQRAVVKATRLAGVRAVVGTGWGGISAGTHSEDVFYISDTPHDWLFARVDAVVHHGGSGTTGAALLAGRPQVVCPFVLDQPFHGRRMHDLGVAPPPLPQRAFTPEALADAVCAAVTDGNMARRAREIGVAVRDEGGVTEAVEVLESLQ